MFSFITSQYTSEHEGLTFPSIDLNKEEKELHGSYLVSYVIDGDTFLTVIDGEEIKVRLIGVDTPESVNEVNPEKNCKEGNIASDYTKKLLAGETVYLEYDINKTYDYGRTLAYVYLDESGSDMVQERLLKDGMANVISVGSNIKYLFKFIGYILAFFRGNAFHTKKPLRFVFHYFKSAVAELVNDFFRK